MAFRPPYRDDDYPPTGEKLKPDGVRYARFSRKTGGVWLDQVTGKAYRTLDELVQSRKDSPAFEVMRKRLITPYEEDEFGDAPVPTLADAVAEYKLAGVGPFTGQAADTAEVLPTEEV